VLSDTVGFIRELPHDLVAAFRATLAEATEADLLLHVIDASAPDRDDQVAAVEAVLAEIGPTRSADPGAEQVRPRGPLDRGDARPLWYHLRGLRKRPHRRRLQRTARRTVRAPGARDCRVPDHPLPA